MTLSNEIFAQIEQLLHEQLLQRGIDSKTVDPAVISKGMTCLTYPDGTMEYSFNNELLLRVIQEKDSEGNPTGYKLYTN